MRLLGAALLAAAGCSTSIEAGDFLDAGSDVIVGCDASYCGALCSRCLEADAGCAETVIGACNVIGACVLRPPVCTFTEPRHPDSACLGLRCGDPCAPSCTPVGQACADAGAPLHCNREGVCSAATPSCGP